LQAERKSIPASKSNSVILLTFFIIWISKLKLFYKQISVLLAENEEKLT